MPGSNLNGCGIATAHALARCGFGEKLVNALDTHSGDILSTYLAQWRDALRAELRTNSHGFMPRKQAKLADSLPNMFPNLKVLRAYVQPVTSESEARLAGLSPSMPQIRWPHEHSLAALATICEDKFEWGTVQIIPRRFRNLLWHGSVIRMLRQAMLDLDRDGGDLGGNGHVGLPEKPSTDSYTDADPRTPTKSCKQGGEAARGPAAGTPSKTISKSFAGISLCSPVRQRGVSGNRDAAKTRTNDEHPLITRITSTTTHSRTDSLLEYRIQLDPYRLVHLTQSGIEGRRDEPVEASGISEEDEDVDGPKRRKYKPRVADPFSLHRIWVPASMLQPVKKALVDAYKAEQETKRAEMFHKAVSKGKRCVMAPDTYTTAPASTAMPGSRGRKGASALAGIRANMPVSTSNNDNEIFDPATFPDPSCSDGSRNCSATKRPLASRVSEEATTSDRKVRRKVTADPELDSNTDSGGKLLCISPSPPRQSVTPSLLPQKERGQTVAGHPVGAPSLQHVQAVRDESKTSYPSLLQVLDAINCGDLFPPSPRASIPSKLPPPSPAHERECRGMQVELTAAPSPHQDVWITHTRGSGQECSQFYPVKKSLSVGNAMTSTATRNRGTGLPEAQRACQHSGTKFTPA